MTNSSDKSDSTVRYRETQGALVTFLEALEAVQQSIRFDDISSAQRELVERVGSALDTAEAELDRDTSDGEIHKVLSEALVLCRRAFDLFRDDIGWPAFAQHYLASRGTQCSALELLYNNRHALPLVDAFFYLDGSAPPLDEAVAQGGIRHREMNSDHGDYSLYVPESYQAGTAHPLIVCLHGSSGHGNEYVWTWLRAARSRAYFVLSPKSYAPTWSMMQPSLDGDSILAMIDEVASEFGIDGARILLTGLSDGATFSYLLGLSHPERFAACAPIAGVLSPGLDPVLRAGGGKSLPLHVVHGVHDRIFPVATARSTSNLLERLGYQVKYTELPQWGHALTYRINEQIVLPWFDGIIESTN